MFLKLVAHQIGWLLSYKLECDCQEAVQNVYSWVHRDEDRSRARLEELGLPAPLAAPPLMDAEFEGADAGVLVDDDGKEAAEAICESVGATHSTTELPPMVLGQPTPPLSGTKWATHLKIQNVQFDLD